MPKKMGTNTKAVEAKARKEEKKQTELAAKQKQMEDEYWRDDDKKLNKKQNRKEDRELKKLQQLETKKEKQRILEEEESNLTKSQPPAKITQYQLNQMQVKPKQNPKEVEPEIPTISNTLEPNEGDARNVDEALQVLTLEEDASLQKHPEKRMKAAFKAFEAERYEQIKAENPSLKYTQWQQILRKEFEKSPSNPKNQQYAAFNTKN